MSDLAPLQGLLIVVEAVAASVLLPPMAWLLAKAWRKSAAGRRMVWITAFAMLLALPLLALVAPSLAVIALAAPPPAPDAAPAVVADPGPRGFSLLDLIPLAAAVWLAGLVKLGVQHVVALVRLELMRRAAAPWPAPTPIPVRGCALLVSEDCPGPMTWGVLRPVIMLPDAALDWPAERLATVLRHELAHVRRRDGLAQALALVACALYWPNPLVWGAARALRREAELAADDVVIASGVRPSDYAGQLLELAAEWRERRLTPTGLAMAAPPALSQRVQSILSTDAIRTGATAMDTFKLVLLGGAATAALTLARPSVAEVPARAAGQATQHIEQGDAQQPASAQHLEPGSAEPAGAAKSVRYHDQTYRFTVAAADKPAAGAGASGGPDSETRLAQDLRAAPPVGKVDAQPIAPPPPAPPAFASPAPAAPAAPPVPPAPRLFAGPPAPPAIGAPRFRDGRIMTPEQRADLDRQLAAIGPAIDKAIKDAHIDETVQRALAAQDAKTREEVARQLQEIGPKIQRAVANAHIQELVQQRLAELQPQIEAAMAQARESRRQGAEQQAQAEERAAQRLEEQAQRARERAQRARERAAQPQPQPAQPPQPPKN